MKSRAEDEIILLFETEKKLFNPRIKKKLFDIQTRLDIILLQSVINKGDYYEFGSDTKYVQKFTNIAKSILSSLEKLNPYFDLNTKPVIICNSYCTVFSKIENIIQTAEKIRISKYGTRENTIKIITQLQDCVNELSDLIGKFK